MRSSELRKLKLFEMRIKTWNFWTTTYEVRSNAFLTSLSAHCALCCGGNGVLFVAIFTSMKINNCMDWGKPNNEIQTSWSAIVMYVLQTSDESVRRNAYLGYKTFTLLMIVFIYTFRCLVPFILSIIFISSPFMISSLFEFLQSIT